jgi:hypothetical protein
MADDKIGLIFVFGSNLAGRHGKGAALFARKHYGAIYGQGEGRQGQSYAIPTKDEQLKTLDLDDIQYYCERFIHYAEMNPTEHFKLTPIGCGLAGYKPYHIAPFFVDTPKNVLLPQEFIDELSN